jgi:hypothetical protein
MSSSAISTPTFQATNSSIAQDGSADSPRGFGNVTTTGTFNITATGPSLYRVVVATPAAPITAALPTTVKAGYRCRIEVELTGSTETNCFFTSPAIAEAQINGTGFVELMALVDNPSTAGDWKVTDVEENVTTVTTSVSGPIPTTSITLVLSRRNRNVAVFYNTFSATGNNTSGVIETPDGVVPARFRPGGSSTERNSYSQSGTVSGVDVVTVRTSFTSGGRVRWLNRDSNFSGSTSTHAVKSATLVYMRSV